MRGYRDEATSEFFLKKIICRASSKRNANVREYRKVEEANFDMREQKYPIEAGWDDLHDLTKVAI